MAILECCIGPRSPATNLITKIAKVSEFNINFRLLEDSTFVTKLNVSEVRLNHDARFPWLILIPEIVGLKELHDIPDQKQAIVQKEVNFCSAALQELASADKMNVAALGNLVPQLHIHVIARKHNDNAWPQPVWSAGEAKPYEEENLAMLVNKLRQSLSN